MDIEKMPKKQEEVEAETNEEETRREDLVFDQASNSMITSEEYLKKTKDKLDDPFGDAEK